MNSFEKRQMQLLADSACDVVVIIANRQIQQSADQPYPFSQDRNFYYLTGIDEPDWKLVVTKNERWLIAPKADAQRELFDGASPIQALSKSAQTKAFDFNQGTAKLKQALQAGHRVGTLLNPPRYIARAHMFANPARKQFLEYLKRHTSAEIVDLRTILAAMRMRKDEAEINEIEIMAKATLAVLDQVAGRLDTFRSEAEVDQFITKSFIERGLSHAYAPIVASGANAATIHYKANNQPLIADKPLLIDVGARRGYYAADITRTLLPKNADPLSRDILSRVESVQKQLFAELKPGLYMRDIESMAVDLIGNELIELGWIETRLTKHIRQFFPHAVSHFLGLDVHDAGDYEQPLEEGMVLTIEPGIYNQQYNLGIRVEDDVVITRDGARILGYNE